jgi:large exoprotein involved in heme utilization and adhesion
LNGGRVRLAGSTGVNVNLTARNITIQSGNQVTGISSSPSTVGGIISLNAKQTLKMIGTNSLITSVITGAGKGTDIKIQAQNLEISQGANISTFTQGVGRGGNLTVIVNDLVSADGRGSGLFVNSRGTDTKLAEGSAGDLNIQAPFLNLSNGAQINSVSGQSSGNSGNIELTIPKSINLSGADISPSRPIPVVPTVISTETAGTGKAGELKISTGKLGILGGAQIITSTLGAGNAGQLTIQASEIEISGAAKDPNGQFVISPNGNRQASAITSDAQRTSTGQGADLLITTDRLTVKEGAVIQSATFSRGNAGNITIMAKESVQLQGIAPTPEDPFPSSIIAFSGGIPNRKGFSVPEATGKGGNITIATPTLKLTDGAIIALGSLNATAQAKGAGDRLKITADIISLNNAELNAQTNAGNGGTFDLTANQLLFLRNSSRIITQAGGLNQDGNAGNISITSPLIVARKSENSDINANASKGNGGNIFITAKSIVGLEIRPRLTEFSDITASSDRGVQGTITLNSPKIDPDRGTLSLPTVPNDPSNQIDQTCSPNSSVASQFTVAGNGGLPATPQTSRFLSLPPRLASLPKSSLTPQNTAFSEASNSIREAQGIQRLANGKIRLLAEEKRGAVMLGLNQHCR